MCLVLQRLQELVHGLANSNSGSLSLKPSIQDKGGSPRARASGEDINKALVVMIAQNLAQIAHLNARIHSARRVFFTGNFLRRNDLALRAIVHSMQTWSHLDQCLTEAVFFRHEGYFGAVGAFLQTIDPQFVRDLDFECSSQSSHAEAQASPPSAAPAPTAYGI